MFTKNPCWFNFVNRCSLKMIGGVISMKINLPIEDVISSIVIKGPSISLNKEAIIGKLPEATVSHLEQKVNEINQSDIELKTNSIVETLIISVVNHLLTSVIGLIVNIGYAEFCKRYEAHKLYGGSCNE